MVSPLPHSNPRAGVAWRIAGPRAADANTDAEPATDPSVAIGHDPGPLLERRHDRLQSCSFAQLSPQGVDMPTGHQENVAQSLIAQPTQKEFRTGHEGLLLGCKSRSHCTDRVTVFGQLQRRPASDRGLQVPAAWFRSYP